MSLTVIDRCCAILRATDDGDKLSPSHLALIEALVNAHDTLSEKGFQMLAELESAVFSVGGYVKPYHLDVEFMTKDLEGYIYFKGTQVEHYSYYNDEGHIREKKALQDLQIGCLKAEKEGTPLHKVCFNLD